MAVRVSMVDLVSMTDVLSPPCLNKNVIAKKQELDILNINCNSF